MKLYNSVYWIERWQCCIIDNSVDSNTHQTFSLVFAGLQWSLVGSLWWTRAGSTTWASTTHTWTSGEGRTLVRLLKSFITLHRILDKVFKYIFTDQKQSQTFTTLRHQPQTRHISYKYSIDCLYEPELYIMLSAYTKRDKQWLLILICCTFFSFSVETLSLCRKGCLVFSLEPN